jgi:hypothetical protein
VLIDYEASRLCSGAVSKREDYTAVAMLMQYYMQEMDEDPQLFGLYLRLACGELKDIERFIDEGCRYRLDD